MTTLSAQIRRFASCFVPIFPGGHIVKCNRSFKEPSTSCQTVCLKLLKVRHINMCVCVCVPCPSSASSGRTGCHSLLPAALPVSDWSSRRSSFAWQDQAAFPPEKGQKTSLCTGTITETKYNHHETARTECKASRKSFTLMFCASTLALASNSRLMTVVLPASTAQCSAVFLWYLSPRLTETLKVSSSRVGSTLSHRGRKQVKLSCEIHLLRWLCHLLGFKTHECSWVDCSKTPLPKHLVELNKYLYIVFYNMSWHC